MTLFFNRSKSIKARFAPCCFLYENNGVRRYLRCGDFLIFLALLLFLPSVVSAVSTRTFTTDTEFSLFEKQKVVVAGTSGEGAYLSLENRWDTLGISSPQRRYWSSVGIDSTTAVVLIAGGRNSSSQGGLSDNWVFDISQNKWTQLSPSGQIPPARYGHNLVSVGSGRYLLFGGLSSEGHLGDTRIYDTSLNYWFWGNYSVSPSSRVFAAAALDTRRGRVWLFGGENPSGANNELWYYDISAGAWNYVIQFSTPLARAGAGLVYLKKSDTLLLFGGYTSAGQRLGDLWHFSIDASTWTQIIQPLTRPSARRYHTLIYDEILDKAVLFGGDAEPSPNIANDLWMYDISSNKWSSASPLNTPPDGRYGSAGGYISYGGSHYLFLFGGTGPLAPSGDCWDDTWLYTAESSGSFVTTSVSVQAPTGVIWKNVSLEPTAQPSDTTRKFQISVSSDGANWTNFAGPNGDENQFFQYAGAPIDIDYLTWRNRPNLKVKFFLSTLSPPQSATVDKLMVSYNRPPFAPQLQYPPSGKRTNRLSPYFMWQRPSDPDDGDAIVFYEIQISASSDFSPVYFSSGGIPSGDFDIKTSTPGASLYEKKWYWRVRASDGNDYGLWSQYYDLTVDTTPPAPVSGFTASRGLGNGVIYTSFNLSGDDGNSVALNQALSLLRCATYPILNENDWSSAQYEKITPISYSPAGARVSVDMTGLADATTYYFNARIVDQAGNYGALMGISPSAATNSTPSVNLVKSPVGILSGDFEINWLSSEPDGDDYYLDVYVSSDGGSGYSRFNEGTSLPPETTFYTMNTRRLRNGDFYRVKITAVDSAGLSSSSVSGIFSVSNPNEPPYDVQIYSPQNGDTISKLYTVRWTLKDNNLCDNHNTAVYISSDGGKSFNKIGESTTDFFIVDTTLLLNGTDYFINIKTTDDGAPPLSSWATPVFFRVKNDNLPPGAFSLKEPPDKKARTALGFYFEWEPSYDPNPSDKVFYRLEYSTSPDFSPYYAVVSGLSATRYYPADTDKMVSDITGSATYYWRVYAVDQFGEERLASDGYREFYLMDRTRATTDDNRLTVKALKGLPQGAFVKVEEIDYGADEENDTYSALRFADKKTLGDPFIKDIELSSRGNIVFKVGFYDVNMKDVLPDGDVEIEILYDYSGNSGIPYVEQRVSVGKPSSSRTHIKDFVTRYLKNLRVATLDNQNLLWRIAPSMPEFGSGGKQEMYTIVYSTGYFKFVGALTPSYTLMGLTSYPNPFNPLKEKCHIVYTLSSPSDIEISIYTIAGRLVKKSVFPSGTDGARSQPSGYTNEVFWDGRNDEGMIVASGVYILEVSGGGTKLRRKIAVARR